MAKAKKVTGLSLEKVIEFLDGRGIKAMKVNENTIKLPYVWGTGIELPATDKPLTVLNAYHVPVTIKALA